MSGSDGKIEFRELRRADVPSFERVVLQGFGRFEAATGLGAGVAEQLRALRGIGLWTLVRFLQAIRLAPIRLIVGVDDGTVVGTCLLYGMPNSGYVGGVVTEAKARGRGVATGVMELARTTAGAQGKRWLALDVESENETAIRLYRHLGYTELARYDWYVGTPIPAPDTSETPGVEISLKDKGAVRWVNQTMPLGIHDPLPARTNSLTHLEFLVRTPKNRRKAWSLSTGDRMVGVVRGCYAPKIQTGFVFAITPDPSLPSESLRGLVKPAIDWHRAMGASKVVVAVRQNTGDWASVAQSFGLQLGVTTVLMVRPSGPAPHAAAAGPRAS